MLLDGLRTRYPIFFGAWLSLVERLVRDQEAGGSNPLAPTIFYGHGREAHDRREQRGADSGIIEL